MKFEMKFHSFIYSVVAGAMLASSATSCTDSFESINTDPNTLPMGELNPYGVFEAMFYGMTNRQLYFTWAYNGEIVQYSGYTAGQGKDFHRYSFNNNNVQTVWDNYARYAANANHMAYLGEHKDEPACRAVGLTLKVFCMSNLTDIFGDIPYSEAFQYDLGNYAPKFDSQKEVYEQMFAELEEANTIYATAPTFSKPNIDLMYHGDMTLWRKFNNSIYLRLLMRVSGRPEMNADEKISEIVSKPKNYPIISSNEESATVKFTGVDPYYNYFRPTNFTKNNFVGYRLANTMLDLMLNTGSQTEQDPRIYTMFNQDGGEWQGVQSGCALSDVRLEDDGASYPNYYVLVRDEAPGWLLDYSEVQFILAEAALKGYISGGETAARTYYETAVTASCKKWAELTKYSNKQLEITDQRITDLLNGNLAGWDKNTDHERLIAEQKYVSLYFVGFEAYHELRRTGWPIITIGNGCSYNNFEYPQRLFYPTNTVGSNSAHVAEALERMGGENNLRTSVWWSYKAINGTFTAVRQQN